MPANYSLIPSHKLLSEAEVKKVEEKYKVHRSSFPKMFATDPQAVSLGAKPNDVVAIERDDGNGKYTYYRHVVKG